MASLDDLDARFPHRTRRAVRDDDPQRVDTRFEPACRVRDIDPAAVLRAVSLVSLT
jgi:hypothetical protein